jgi:NTP pyrophosphatase (non-canonical NTP hydrolase)
MKPDWQERAWDNHQRYIKLARKNGKLTSDDDVINFLALAVCGEAGELGNLIKKMWLSEPVDDQKLRDEIADIRIYLEHIAHHLQVDIDQACEHKVEVVAKRIAAKEGRS